MNAPLRPPTPSLRSPLKSTSGTSNVKRRTRTTSASYTSAGDGPVVRSGTRTIYTAGRPPWYNSQGQLKEAFVIGIYYFYCFVTLPLPNIVWLEALYFLSISFMHVCMHTAYVHSETLLTRYLERKHTLM